jgi:hypothetical protein
MNIKLLYCAVLLHSAIAISAQEPLNLKTQMVTQAAVGKLKDLKATRDAAEQRRVTGVAKALLTMCALSAVASVPSVSGQNIPAGLTRYPIYDASCDDCIPVPLYPTIVCIRTSDFNRNMTETMNSMADIDDFYSDYMSKLINSIQTPEELEYVGEGILAGYPNEGWMSQDGSQFKSLAGVRRYPVFGNIAIICSINFGEYQQWRASRSQPNPYTPDFVNGTLRYEQQPNQPYKNLTWWDHGVYLDSAKAKKGMELQQIDQKRALSKFANGSKKMKRSNRTVTISKRQPKFNGSKRGR